MVRFTLATGLRESKVLQLKWQQIDMQRHVTWIHPDQDKTAKAIGVLLNDDVVVAALKALKRAGIERFRQHDLCQT